MSAVPAGFGALVSESEATQWWAPDALAALQAHRLNLVVAHLELHSPQFAGRVRDSGLSCTELTMPGGLQRLAPLSRRRLQSADGLYCDSVPTHHGRTYEVRTSGSTGEPVVVRRTEVNGLDWMAATLRNHLWHAHDFQDRFCSIRADLRGITLMRDWGLPVKWLFKSGPMLGIPITDGLERQIELIRDFKPRFLLIYPSNLAGIVNLGIRLPSVTHILTVGETLSPQARSDAAALFDATVTDTYSSQELGTIAIQCPKAPLHHVMAENLIVEVLAPDGAACRVGEVGRVVITDIRNFATPIIRYDIGDLAEVGPPCACGRGLPTLSRICGRERNLILMPDGTRHWPLVGFHVFRTIAPVVQYQLIQESRDTVEFRLVTQRSLSRQEESSLAAHVRRALGFAFEIRFTYFAQRIPAGPTGKFEEFVCRVAA